MFNKIVASVISSVVMFACNMKEETPVAAEDVVSAEVTAVEQPKVDPVAPPATTVTPPIANVPQPLPAVTSPLVPSPVSAGTTATVTPAPASTQGSVVVPAASSAVAPTTSTLAK